MEEIASLKEQLSRMAERFDEVEREKLFMSQRSEIDKNQLVYVTERLEKEKKRGDECRERESALHAEVVDLKADNRVLKDENGKLKDENGKLKDENGILKEELARLKRSNEELHEEKKKRETCEESIAAHKEREAVLQEEKEKLHGETKELKRRLKEMENDKTEVVTVNKDKSRFNKQLKNTVKKNEPISAAPTPVKRPRQSDSGNEQVVKKPAIGDVIHLSDDEETVKKERIEDPSTKSMPNSVKKEAETSDNTAEELPKKMVRNDTASAGRETDPTKDEMSDNGEEDMGVDDRSDEDYHPNSLNSSARKPKSDEKVTYLNCAVCSSDIKKGTGSDTFKTHAMVHCEEKRFKCPHCPKHCTTTGHMDSHKTANHKGKEEKTIDKKNALREALWKHWMYKCFPDIDRFVTRRRTKPVSSKKCEKCSEEIQGTEIDHFSHVISEHPEEKLDYEDPEGVKKRFFPEE